MVSSGEVMNGSYDYGQVAMSVTVAISSAYAALDLAGRVTAARGWVRFAWWAGGTVVMGIGIWAMHYTGMLAFHLPVPVTYDWPTTLASFLIAAAASGFAWYVLTRPNAGWVNIFVGGIAEGSGIAGLHYVAMDAMRFTGDCMFNPGIVTLSVLLAIGHSVAGLWLAFKFRNPTGVTGWWKILGGVLLGAGIAAMHYTAMAGTTFLRSAVAPDLSHAANITTLGAAGIGVVAIMVQSLAVLTSFVDRRFYAQAQELRFTQELSARVFRSQDEERRRIARQLHETVAQSLAALKMNLAKIGRLITGDASARDVLVESVLLTDEAIKEIRTLSYVLHPPLLEEGGLAPGLRWYATGFAERSGINVQLDVPPDLERMPEQIEIAVFRIVQECLSNIHRHSGSAKAWIRVVREGNNLRVEVEDEGEGMPAAHALGYAGVGLAGIRERVIQLGGQLEIHSSSHGTQITVILPLHRVS